MEIPKVRYQPIRLPQNSISDPPKQEYTPPDVPQNAENSSLPQNYQYTDWAWLQLYLNSQFPPVRPQDQPPPQD